MKQALFFTAPWCAPCVPVKLEWMRAIRRFPDIARRPVDVTTPEGKSVVDGFKKQGFYVQGLPWIVLVDDDGKIFKAWGPHGCSKANETDYETTLEHWEAQR